MLESVRDMNVASRLIGDMSGPTLDDPLFDRYQKLGCLISPVDKRSEDYKMIVDYLERTYEPVKHRDIVLTIAFIGLLHFAINFIVQSIMNSVSTFYCVRAMESPLRTYSLLSQMLALPLVK